MKNIVFFITHTTLTYEHLDLCFASLSIQNTAKKFDKLYIYNTHQEELPNWSIISLYHKYNLDKLFESYDIFDYDTNISKTLAGDISAIRRYVEHKYCANDRILFLKSDCLLSKNYCKDILSIDKQKRNIYFVAPWMCAKKHVPNIEILEYINRDSVVFSDEITFCVEHYDKTFKTDFDNNKPLEFKFTSCYVIGDYSCPFISVGLLDKLIIENLEWGGVKFYLIPNQYFIPTNKSFVVHKYHSILSENSSIDRSGPVKGWLED
jgi:hypothetical protein